MKLKFPTLSYKYDDEEEFIFCVKGKPFPCLVSPKLPTPTSTLIDFDMIHKLGLKMADLQCKKYTYAGHKMRVLGTVYTSVQCIQDGQMCGTIKIKADVVEDLAKNLEVQCVAGQRMAAQLKGKDDNCTPSGAQSTPSISSPSAKPKPRAAPSPKPRSALTPKPLSAPAPPRTPSPPTTPSSSSPPTTPSRSPPGFPTTPQYEPPRAHLLRKVRPLSPWSLNTKKLDEMFAKADLEKEGEAEFDRLTDQDDAGIISIDDKTGLLAFTASDGTSYIQGHGRYKCSRVRCYEDPWVTSVPDNCGYSSAQWTFPDEFTPCGENCRGAFCNCLHFYVKRL